MRSLDRANFQKGISTSLITRVLAIIVSFFSTPLFISYFGASQYGIILGINSLLAFSNILSLGVPSAIGGIGAQVHTRAKVSFLLRRVLKLYALYLFTLLIAYILLSPFINAVILQSIFPRADSAELSPAIFWGMLILMINTFFSVFWSALMGLHRIDVWNVFSTMLGLVPFCALLFLRVIKGSLQEFFLVYFLFALFLSLVMAICYFMLYYQSDSSLVDPTEYRLSYRNILATALTTEGIFVIGYILSQVDYLMISHFSGSGPLVQYALIDKMLSFENTFICLLFPSLGILFAKWFAEGNWAQINAIYALFLKVMAIMGGGVIIGNILFMRIVITLWVGPDQFGGLVLVLMSSVFIYLFAVYSANYVVFSSFNVKRKLSLSLSWIEPAAKLMATYYLTQLYGIVGTGLSRLLIAFFLTSWMCPVILHYYSDKNVRLDYRFIVQHLVLLVIPLTVLGALVENTMPTLVTVGIGLVMLAFYSGVSFYLLNQSEKSKLLQIVGDYIPAFRRISF